MFYWLPNHRNNSSEGGSHNQLAADKATPNEPGGPNKDHSENMFEAENETEGEEAEVFLFNYYLILLKLIWI